MFAPLDVKTLEVKLVLQTPYPKLLGDISKGSGNGSDQSKDNN